MRCVTKFVNSIEKYKLSYNIKDTCMKMNFDKIK